MKNKLIGFSLALLVILLIAAGVGTLYIGQFQGLDVGNVGITNTAGLTIDQRATTQAQNVVSNTTPGVYYVATNGLDSNPGSLSQPWLTLDYAITNPLARYGTINVQGPGSYWLSSQEYVQEGETLIGKNRPVIVEATNGSTTSYSGGTISLIVASNNITITGFIFTNSPIATNYQAAIGDYTTYASPHVVTNFNLHGNIFYSVEDVLYFYEGGSKTNIFTGTIANNIFPSPNLWDVMYFVGNGFNLNVTGNVKIGQAIINSINPTGAGHFFEMQHVGNVADFNVATLVGNISYENNSNTVNLFFNGPTSSGYDTVYLSGNIFLNNSSVFGTTNCETTAGQVNIFDAGNSLAGGYLNTTVNSRYYPDSTTITPPVVLRWLNTTNQPIAGSTNILSTDGTNLYWRNDNGLF